MGDFSQWGNPKQYFLGVELSKITDLEIWHEPGNIHDILNKIRFVPDFILILNYKSSSQISPPITGLSSLKIPYGIFIRDLHNLNNLPKYVIDDNVKHIFTCFKDNFRKKFPQLKNMTKWLPNHVNTEIFKDYNHPKDIDMLMMGNTSKKWYPLRNTILKTLSNHPNFIYHSPPKQRIVNDNKKFFVRERYAREINRAKVFFTCDSITQYVVAKYFEVPACKTLLLAPDSPDLYDLGFRSGENFVAINEHDFVAKAKYYLLNDEERERIAENGYKLVHDRHSSAVRAKELLKMIEEILSV